MSQMVPSEPQYCADFWSVRRLVARYQYILYWLLHLLFCISVLCIFCTFTYLKCFFRFIF